MKGKSGAVYNHPYHYQEVPSSRIVPTFHEHVRSGLFASPRQLPCKFFYDAAGSDLFDRICETEEYYPTRTEAALLQHNAEDIIKTLKPEHIIEFGSGTSRKTRYLFNAARTQNLALQYWPFDVCGPILKIAAEELLLDYPGIKVNVLVGDYLAGFNAFPEIGGQRRLFIFLGGTIGNFQQHEAINFLRELRRLMQPGDALLIGFDRVKEKAILEAAYNDHTGITAEFNLNILNVINRELAANFNLNDFQHEARFNEQAQQIEMYLIARDTVEVEIPALDNSVLVFKVGDRILTEISRKFTPLSIATLLNEGGYEMGRHYEAVDAYYSLVLARIN